MPRRLTTYRGWLTSSQRWAAFRSKVHGRAGRVCEHCRTGATLEIHHVVYRAKRSDLRLTDVLALCRRCHLAAHDRRADLAQLEADARARGLYWPPMPAAPPPTPWWENGAGRWDDLAGEWSGETRKRFTDPTTATTAWVAVRTPETTATLSAAPPPATMAVQGVLFNVDDETGVAW